MSAREPSADPLAAALLPVLLHRIRNTTQLVSGLHEVLTMDAAGSPPAASGSGAKPPRRRGDDLAAAAREADELGWLLGVVAGGLGADLLLQRCEPRGLATALELVRDALRREGRDLQLPAELPTMTPEVPSHGELCWVAAALVFAGGSAASPSTPPALSIESVAGTWELAVRGAELPDGRTAERVVAERLAGAQLHGGGGEWRLSLPGPWLSWPTRT